LQFEGESPGGHPQGTPAKVSFPFGIPFTDLSLDSFFVHVRAASPDGEGRLLFYEQLRRKKEKGLSPEGELIIVHMFCCCQAFIVSK
jgi:hypothetical protein